MVIEAIRIMKIVIVKNVIVETSNEIHLLKPCIFTNFSGLFRWGYNNTPPDSPRNAEQSRQLVPELDIYAIPSVEGKF